MRSLISDLIRKDSEYAELLRILLAQKEALKPLPALVTGLSGGATDAICVSLTEDLRRAGGRAPVLCLCPDEHDCEAVSSVLVSFGLTVTHFPERDFTFYNISASHEYEYARIKALYEILYGIPDVVLATPESLLSYTIPPETLMRGIVRLSFDSNAVGPKALVDRLREDGYMRVEMVDAPGQYAVRGDIVDVYPPCARYTDLDGKTFYGSYPLRMEYFGEDPDRMELFDITSQRMTVTLDKAELIPAREILFDETKKAGLIEILRKLEKTAPDDLSREEIRSEIATAEGGGDLLFADKYISYFYPEKKSLSDYWSSMPFVLVRSPMNCAERLKAVDILTRETVQELLMQKVLNGKYAEYRKEAGSYAYFLSRSSVAYLESLGQGMSNQKFSGILHFRTKHTVSYNGNATLLLEDVNSYRNAGFRIAVLTENETEAKNLGEMFREKGFVPVVASDNESPKPEDFGVSHVYIEYRRKIRGYEVSSSRFVLLSIVPENSLSGKRSSHSLRAAKRKKSAAERIITLDDLHEGDYVVHEEHGIGQYFGITNLVVGGVCRDYIEIHYDGAGKLFLPTEHMDLISKYIGAHADDGLLKLSKLGGAEWSRAKSRAKAAAKDIAKDLIELYARRMKTPGFAFQEDDDLQKDFEAAFDYEETDCQLEAVADIKSDMEKPTPMDRLLCGDVGFGKTEVALRAAYKAILGGKQVAILVPTTILALQHYHTILSRMRSFSVNVEMLSRLRSPKEQEAILRKLRRGEIDIIVGTHKLISAQIEFKDLGLLIVDEEQRFGVAQKEKLKQMAGNVDVLTLTATPIPRTLNMAMGGIRDISLLDEAPGERLPVQTYVMEHEELILLEAMKREMRRGGQIFWLHNNVDTIFSCASKLQDQLPDARIIVAHGQMEKDEIEEIWSEMLAGNVDILVCTTIIETGVDIPNANTLIVENAQRLGLSQLHQLRGRVGRSSRRAYAYFTFPKDRQLTEIAAKRLEAIREYAEFGAGFKIAIRDMEIRGAGNLLGSEQHGHMDAIGYDLYIKLLNEAVLEEKGEVQKKESTCTLTLKTDAYIPDSYVPYPSMRVSIYRRIASIEVQEDADDILDELIDRYGDPPAVVQNLLTIALVRASGRRCFINSVVEDEQELRIFLDEFDLEIWQDLSDAFYGRLRVVLGEKTATVRMFKKKGERVPNALLALFRKYEEFDRKRKGESK